MSAQTTEESLQNNDARETCERYRLEANAMMLQRDNAVSALREIANANGFDNIGNWARNLAKKTLKEVV